MTADNYDMDPEDHEERRLRAQELGRSRKGKRYKLRKPRRKSKARQQLEYDAVKGIAASIRQELSDNELNKTFELLKRDYKVNVKNYLTPDTLWDSLLKRDNKLLVRRANETYLRAIIYIAAVYEIVAGSDLNITLHINMICEKAGVSPKRSLDLLREIARLLIDYGSGTEKQQLEGRKAVSRDTLAIRYLFSQGIRPHQIKEYQAKHGGGCGRLVPSRSEIDKQFKVRPRD